METTNAFNPPCSPWPYCPSCEVFLDPVPEVLVAESETVREYRIADNCAVCNTPLERREVKSELHAL